MTDQPTLADRIAVCAGLYRRGYTRAQISAEIGRCEAVVGRYLARAGVKMRPGGGRRLDYEKAARMLAAGVTRAEIARRLRTSRSAITGAINRGTIRVEDGNAPR
jgi:DNA-binding transcriptional regulator LsrR (DeoR family)